MSVFQPPAEKNELAEAEDRADNEAQEIIEQNYNKRKRKRHRNKKGAAGTKQAPG